MCKSVLCEKRHEKLNQVCKQKQCLLLNCCNIFDLLATRTEKIAWWHLFLNLIFTYFPIMNKSGKFIVKFLLYHTYLKASQLQSDNTLFSKETEYFYSKEFPTATQMQVVNNIYSICVTIFVSVYAINPTGIYLFKVNNGNTRTICEFYSKLTIKTPKLRQWRLSGLFIFNFN